MTTMPPEYKPPPRRIYTDLGWVCAALHRSLDWHLRHRNDLVVACGSAQQAVVEVSWAAANGPSRSLSATKPRTRDEARRIASSALASSANG